MRCVLLVFTLMLLSGTATHAEVVFSNLGAGDSFNPLVSYWIPGPATAVGTPPMLVGNTDVGAPFLVDHPHDFRFETAELALSRWDGTNSLIVRLLSDVGGSPGSELASTTIGGIPDIASPALVSADFSAAGITLEAGMRYWLVADSDLDASMFWHQNTLGQEGYAFRTTGDWTVRIELHPAAAFRINGTIVPEPASATLVALFTLVAWRLRRRR
jgi:hypothetical protein